MTGTSTNEFRTVKESLVKFHKALVQHAPGIKFEDLFFEVFSCYETDTETLAKTDFGRYNGAVPIVNGLTKAIVELG